MYSLFSVYWNELFNVSAWPYSICIVLLKQSIPASIVVLAVLLARLLLYSAPKRIRCILWTIVALRLICPFTIESMLSLIPDGFGKGDLVDEWLDSYVTSEFSVVNENGNGHDVGDQNEDTGEEQERNKSIEIVPGQKDRISVQHTIGTRVPQFLFFGWLAGVSGMFSYFVWSYLRLKKQITVTVPYSKEVLLCDEINMPFIMGLVNPRIYLPSDLAEPQLSNVLMHEQTHLKRHDNWWKAFGYLLLSLYWFNPLFWLVYVLFCRDIEMACDEQVIQSMDIDARADYAQVLLDLSRGRHALPISPIAFGEIGIKERVRAVLDYKKPVVFGVGAAVMLCLAIAVCFLTDPVTDDKQTSHNQQPQTDNKIMNTSGKAGELYDTDEISEKTVSEDAAEAYEQMEFNPLDNLTMMVCDDDYLYYAAEGSIHRVSTHNSEETVFEILPGTKGSVRLWNVDNNQLYLSFVVEADPASGIYQFDLSTNQIERIIPTDLLEYDPFWVLAKDGILYLQGQRPEQVTCIDKSGQFVEDDITEILEDAMKTVPSGSYCEMPAYQLLQFHHAVFIDSKDSNIYVYAIDTESTNEIVDAVNNVYPTNKGVVYTDSQGCIHFCTWDGNSTLLYSPDDPYGFLNYLLFDKDGIYCSSLMENGRFDLLYLTWDGRIHVLKHFEGLDDTTIRGIHRSLSVGNEYYCYLYQGQLVIAEKVFEQNNEK